MHAELPWQKSNLIDTEWKWEPPIISFHLGKALEEIMGEETKGLKLYLNESLYHIGRGKVIKSTAD